MKHFNNNNNTDDDTYDDKVRGKRSDIRMMLSRLGNTVSNNDRKKIKRELYEIKKKKNLLKRKKVKNYDHLVELVNTLNKKKEYKRHEGDDLDYYGIRDIEKLFTNDDDDDEEEEEEEDFYKSVVVKTSVKGAYKYYECKGGKDNKLSRKQYLYKIMSYLSDLVNDLKAISNESKEIKIQINMNVNFVSSNDTGEIRTIFVWSDNEEIRPGNETDIIKRLLNSF